MSLMAQELKFNTLLNIKPTLLYYLEILNMVIDGQVCFHKQLFADPVKLQRCTIGSVGPVNDINTDVSGARLVPDYCQ